MSILVIVLSTPFIVSSALNYGFSRFWFGVPFMLITILSSLRVSKNRALALMFTLLSLGSIYLNSNLETNSVVFPILDGGYVEILTDGYLVKYFDGSGAFVSDLSTIGSCSNCGEVIVSKIEKGTRLPVIAVHIGHPDFSTTVNLVTHLGRVSEYNYLKKDVLVSKEVKSTLIDRMTNLMYYPMLIVKLLR